jgi:hypothetical protein
VELMLAN